MREEAYYFRVIPDSEVEIEKRLEAERALLICRRLLPGLPEKTKVEFIEEIPDRKIGELAYDFDIRWRFIDLKSEIFKPLRRKRKIVFKEKYRFYGQTGTISLDNIVQVNVSVPIDKILEVVAHECQHVVDLKVCWPITSELYEQFEKRACEFAKQAIDYDKKR